MLPLAQNVERVASTKLVGCLDHLAAAVGAAEVAPLVGAVLGVQPLPWSYWLAPLLCMLLWGPVYVALDALRVGAWRRR